MMLSRQLIIFFFAILALVNGQESPVNAPIEAPVTAPVATPMAAPAFAPTRRRFPMFFKRSPNASPATPGPKSPNASPRAQAPTRRRFPFGMQLRN